MGLLIESLFLIGLSALGLWEGMRLLKQEHLLADPIGPGGFLAFTSAVLFISAVVYLSRSRFKPRMRKNGWAFPRFGPAGRLLGALGLYAATVPILGYAAGSGLFFILAFRISGVKLWGKSILLGIVIALAFEIFFSRFAKIPLP